MPLEGRGGGGGGGAGVVGGGYRALFKKHNFGKVF